MHRDVLAIVLAGGRGTRLEPLTRDRAKPAVPFGGIYRIIDFTLSNCINSDLRKILVLTQYKAVSLNRHIDQGWKFLCRELDEYIEVIPPQQRIAEHWYQGTADAIYQNVYTIEKAAPRDTLILAGDHIYKMNYAEMIAFHRERRADLTIACLPVPRAQAREFGVMDVDAVGPGHQLPGEAQRPARHARQPRAGARRRWASTSSPPTSCTSCSSRTPPRRRRAATTSARTSSRRCSTDSRVFAYPFRDENRKQAAYWRDVGTLDAYYQTSMDLIQIDPILNLYDRDWPIHTYQPPLPAAEVRPHRPRPPRRGAATRSSARGRSSPAARSTAASSRRACGSTATPWSRTRSSSTASRSAATPGSARRSSTRTCKIPAGFEIGWNREADLARGLTVTEDGVTVVAKGEDLERFTPLGG